MDHISILSHMILDLQLGKLLFKKQDCTTLYYKLAQTFIHSIIVHQNAEHVVFPTIVHHVILDTFYKEGNVFFRHHLINVFKVK